MLFVSGVSSWQQAQVSANWRHSVSGAQRNDKEKQPSKTLVHCADLKSPLTYICKPRARFGKLFWLKSPAKLPVKVRHGYNYCSSKLGASNRRRHIWALPLCVQNWGGRSRESCLWLYYFPVPKWNQRTLQHLILVQAPGLCPAVLPALSSHPSTHQCCRMSCSCKVDIWGRVLWIGKLQI